MSERCYHFNTVQVYKTARSFHLRHMFLPLAAHSWSYRGFLGRAVDSGWTNSANYAGVSSEILCQTFSSTSDLSPSNLDSAAKRSSPCRVEASTRSLLLKASGSNTPFESPSEDVTTSPMDGHCYLLYVSPTRTI